MNQKINYQKQLEEIISSLGSNTPRLLLHSCCGPCSSYCIEYLSNYFEITVFYYNPNIYPDDEYIHRVKEQKEFINRFPAKNKVSFIEGDFDKDRFYKICKGLEHEPERGKRCFECFKLRLSKSYETALENGFDYFTTTLTISPLKDANILNDIGLNLATQSDGMLQWLPSDFKKNNGYKRSTELSKEYNMYRQDYCGCVFSYNERRQL
ncbi:MAG: epoxyqueuosine reductase QueH [Pseudobutyrivibrio sp.]|nr:epoxyqueuosine reductase QueH [Pseudobutyrivibrio sp.]